MWWWFWKKSIQIDVDDDISGVLDDAVVQTNQNPDYSEKGVLVVDSLPNVQWLGLIKYMQMLLMIKN